MSRRDGRSSLLDDEDLHQLDINVDEVQTRKDELAAKSALERWLSVRSILSTTSSNAILQQEAASNAQAQVFRSIGKGFCGEIFEKTGTNRVYKRELKRDGQLWNDYHWHTRIYGAITSGDIEYGDRAIDNFPTLHVPKVYNFITPNGENWWKENLANFSRISPREMTNLLETELIHSLPKLVRQAIITVFCPQKYDKMTVLKDPENQNCLARIYLGVRRPGRSQTEKFSLRNFELDLQALDDLSLEKEHHAREMARALAIMHWKCEVDANDVEFVLGTAPTDLGLTAREIEQLPPYTDTDIALNFKRRAVHLWLLDFNNCSKISMDESGLKKAETAFWHTDPYYPRPVPPKDQDENLWNIFKTSYLEQSAFSASETAKKQNLPQRFIQMVTKTAIDRFMARRMEFLSSSGAGPPRNAPLSIGGPPASGSSSGNPPFGGPPFGGPPFGGPPATSPSGGTSQGGASSSSPSRGSPRRGRHRGKSREYPAPSSGSGAL